MRAWTKEELESRIAEIVAEVLPLSSGTFQEDLLIREDLGADSMQVIALMIAFDAEFDVEFNADDVPDAGVTMGWLRDFIARALTNQRGV
jgi:acyl carrier protein